MVIHLCTDPEHVRCDPEHVRCETYIFQSLPAKKLKMNVFEGLCFHECTLSYLLYTAGCYYNHLWVFVRNTVGCLAQNEAQYYSLKIY